MTFQNTHRFRGFKLTFADWFKFRLIEELTYEIYRQKALSVIDYVHIVQHTFQTLIWLWQIVFRGLKKVTFVIPNT
jgi:hypothetical protein